MVNQSPFKGIQIFKNLSNNDVHPVLKLSREQMTERKLGHCSRRYGQEPGNVLLGSHEAVCVYVCASAYEECEYVHIVLYVWSTASFGQNENEHPLVVVFNKTTTPSSPFTD